MKKIIALTLIISLLSGVSFSLASASDSTPTKTYDVLDMSFEIPIDTEVSQAVDGELTHHYLYPVSATNPGRLNGGVVYASEGELERGVWNSFTAFTLDDAEGFYSSFFSAFKENEGHTLLNAVTHSLGINKYLHHRVFTEVVNRSVYLNDAYCFLIDGKYYYLQFMSSSQLGQVIPSRIKPLILRSLSIDYFFLQTFSLPLSMLRMLREETVELIEPQEYRTFEYRKIARNPYDYKGELVVYTGKVIQVMEDGLNVTLRMKLDDEDPSISDVIYVDYVRSNERESRTLEGDHVTIYGALDGLETYSTVLRSQANIPRMIAYYIDLLED